MHEARASGRGEPEQIWNVRGAHSTGGLATLPAEYEGRVVGFFDEALLEE